MNQPEKRPVTLEDLLRLKRAERPAAEFWEQFDRELRAKQLAAIMEEKPWWRSLRMPAIFARGFRFYLPLGTAAALALTLMVMRNGTGQVAATVAVAGLVAEPASTGVAGASDAAAAFEINPPSSASHASVALADASSGTAHAIEQISAVAATDAATVQPTAESSRLSESLALAVMPALADTPSGRLIAANLAAAVQNEEAVAGMGQLYQSRSAEAPRRRTAKVEEPLMQTASAGNTRFSKMLSKVSMASYEPDTMRSSSERQARRLPDEAVYAPGPSRFGGNPAGLNLKL